MDLDSYCGRKMDRWSGSVALVAGGLGGIGAAIVRRLASHGITVVVTARQIERVQVDYWISLVSALNLIY